MQTGSDSRTASEEQRAASSRVSWRLRRYPVAILVALGLALTVAVLSGDEASTASGRLGGDYPAFYGAGRIAADGDWDELYSSARQVEAQRGLFLDDGTPYFYFAYPPHVAIAYRPFAAIQFRWSYLLHTLGMGGALALAIHLAKPMISSLRRRTALALAAALLFYPMTRAVLGGQNTALTLLLLVAAWRFAHEENYLLAGGALALLFYKPQFALPLAGLFLLVGLWRAVLVAAAGVGVIYTVGLWTMGPEWVAEWYSKATTFAQIDAEVNGHNAVSWQGFLENIFGVGHPAVTAVALLLMGLTALGLAYVWWRGPRAEFPAKMALAAVGMVLMAPHVMYYDSGVILLTLGVLTVTRPVIAGLFAAVWLIAPLQYLAELQLIGFSPVFFAVVLTAAWAAWLLVPRLLRPEESIQYPVTSSQ